jgi:FtsZ-binding cell division protein ZapB
MAEKKFDPPDEVMTITEAKPEPKPHAEPTITLSQSQIGEMVQKMVREQLAEQAATAKRTAEADARKAQSLKDAEVEKQAALRAQDDPYEPIPGIMWVFNRSRRPIEVVWDMRTTVLPPLTVKPVTDAVAFQALKTGAYKNMGTPEGVSVIVLKGDLNWRVPLSDEEQAYYEGTDPILHSRIPLAQTLTYEGKVLSPPEVVHFTPTGAPAHSPPLERDVTVTAVGAKP